MPAIRRMLDLTQDLFHMAPGLPDTPPPEIKLAMKGATDGWTVETLTMTLHWGTHMDAPMHLYPYTQTIDQIPVEHLQGPAVAIDLFAKPDGAPIEPADLAPYGDRVAEGTIVLLCTGRGERAAWTREYIYQTPHLTPAGARWLADRGVRGVGIDHFSVGGLVETNEEAHRALLSKGVWIAEGLLLPKAICEGGSWHLFALPLKVRGGSGAQARVIAVEYGDQSP